LACVEAIVFGAKTLSMEKIIFLSKETKSWQHHGPESGRGCGRLLLSEEKSGMSLREGCCGTSQLRKHD